MSAKGLRQCEKGTAAIEFAMVAPVLFLMTIGSFNLAWSLHCIGSAQYAMSKAARVLELNPNMTQSEIEKVVRTNAQIDGRDLLQLKVKVEPAAEGVRLAHANLEYPLAIWIPIIGTYELTYRTSLTVPLSAF